jgi:hypothetical protein
VNRLKRCLCVLSVICSAALGGANAFSQTSIAPSANEGGKYGLWRDFDGHLWCGGSCGVGQQCCDIVTN